MYPIPFIVLKNRTINGIFVKGENGFPLQTTCFPMGERRAASSAPASFRGSPVSITYGSQVAFHANLQKCYLFRIGFSNKVKLFTTLYEEVLSRITSPL